MIKFFLITLILITSTNVYSKNGYQINNDIIFPEKIYSNNEKIENNEIFPSKILLGDDDIYVTYLKNTISDKLITNQSIEKESYDFLMCFIFDIKPFVKNEKDFSSFKSEPKYLTNRQKIINDCSKQSKITQKNFEKFINILNEI